MKSWLEKNDIETYSTHNEVKSVVTERFIRNLTKIYKYMTSISKILYTEELKKLKTLFHGHMLFVILMVKKLLQHFIK